MKLIVKYLAMFCLLPLASLTFAQQVDQSTGLQFTYFGAAGWKISDNEVTVLIDPYISRLQYTDRNHPDDDRPQFARDDVGISDTDLIDSLITKADFILVQHAHYDHLGDVPYIAKKTGAKVIGTETAIMILRAYGIPDEQLYAVGGGEDYQFENFSVRVIPSIHSALNDKHYFDSRRYDRTTELTAPLRIDQFIEGGALMFLARFGDHTVLTMGSMNFVEHDLEGIHPDILLAGINGSRLGLYNYDERLINVTGKPAVIIPTHWDSFNLPYSFSQQENVDKKLVPFKKTVAEISPESKVVIPVHLEPFVIDEASLSVAQDEHQKSNYDPEAKLEELGIVLPPAPEPVANYVNGVRTGNLIFLAGKGPKRADGSELHGKLGADVSIEEGYEGARITAINQLAVLKEMLGDLSKVKRVVKVLGMVNSTPDFVQQPAVINGFSDLIVEIFGERGRHARAAVGMASLPRGQSVEIEMIVEVEDQE